MDKFVELLREVAAKLGMEAARLWPQLVWMYWINTLGEMLLVPVFVLVAALISRRLFNTANTKYSKDMALRKGDYSDSNENQRTARLVPAWILVAAAAVVGAIYIFSFPQMVATLFYPEAGLVRSLTHK